MEDNHSMTMNYVWPQQGFVLLSSFVQMDHLAHSDSVFCKNPPKPNHQENKTN